MQPQKNKPVHNKTAGGNVKSNLFWQSMYKTGYIHRGMDCYCKEEGVCPFEQL